MKIGTKSILYGAHCFFIHPWFVALAWWKLYGFPWDPRLWVAFFVHDLGYFGKPNMDGPEGELHPWWGARVMSALFDEPWEREPFLSDPEKGALSLVVDGVEYGIPGGARVHMLGKWGKFVLFHSRYLAKKYGEQPTLLCVADKLAIALTPAWLYLPMVNLTGEIEEYMKDAEEKHPDMGWSGKDQRGWFAHVQDYCRDWALTHRDGQEDTWTRLRS